MWRVDVEPAMPDESALSVAAAALARGEVVAFPTDTLYGLAADPRNPGAIARVYRIKGRAAGQALPLIAADLAQLAAVGVRLGPLAQRLAEAWWPGPLTLVVPAWPGLCPEALAGADTVAVRVPAHAVAVALARAHGYPITSTSANRSGTAPTRAVDDLVADLGDVLDGLVAAGDCPGGPPSTIVETTGSAITLLRAGAVPWDRVLESVQ